MRRSRNRRAGWVAGPLLFGVVIVALSIGLILWRSRSTRAMDDTPSRFPGSRTVVDLDSKLRSPGLGRPLAVAILRDSASDLYYDSPAVMDTVVDLWKKALTAVGAVPQVVSPAQAMRATDVAVFVVPSTPCLGRDARRALDLATERGQGLVITWLTGVRDGGCKAVGYGFITAMSGASRLDTTSAKSRESYVTFIRGGPLSEDIPPGSRMELQVAPEVALRAPGREAFFSDYTLNPRSVGDLPFLDGAVAHTTVKRSRVVYWGFDLERVVRHPWSEGVALRLVRNSIGWVASMPLATVLPWPKGKLAAAVLAQDVEDQFANGKYALDSLRAAGVHGTYFLVSRLALKNEDLARAMAAQGEVGSHTPEHRLLGGETPAHQAAQLQQSQRELASIIGHSVAGLRPPEEQFDAVTLNEWAKAGGRYLFGANNARTASPEIIDLDGRAIVLLGRVINDDFISVKRAGVRNVAQLATEYLTALDKVKALGGLYILSYHSQLLARPELVPALAKVARAVAADTSLWVATAGEVAQWWVERNLIDVSASYTDSTHLRVDVRNRAERPVTGAAIRVAIGSATATAATGAQLLPGDDTSVRVLLPRLLPRSMSTVTITLARPPIDSRPVPLPTAPAAGRVALAR